MYHVDCAQSVFPVRLKNGERHFRTLKQRELRLPIRKLNPMTTSTFDPTHVSMRAALLSSVLLLHLPCAEGSPPDFEISFNQKSQKGQHFEAGTQPIAKSLEDGVLDPTRGSISVWFQPRWTRESTRSRFGRPVHGLRRIYIATQEEKEDRQITALRQGLGRRRTRVLNKIQRILHRYNLMWQYPTKSFQTQTGQAWLQKLSLPEIDRFELDLLLEEWMSIEEQIKQVDEKIVERASRREPGKLFTPTQILMTAPGVSYYSGLGLASRIGPVERFPRPRSLAN